MKKLLILIGILAILIGGFFALNSYIYNEKQADFVVGDTVSKSGVILSVDLEQAALDGPYILTIESDDGELSAISVPSMGLPLCPAYQNKNIGDVYLLKQGDKIEVRGEVAEDGTIVPCSLSEHYLRPEAWVEENFEGEADPSRMTLGMTTWRWQNALYNDGREIKPKSPGAFTLKFNNDGTFSATTDCNSAGGKYSAGTNGTISFTDIFSTKMYCEGSQEAEFIQMLANSSEYLFTSKGELVLGLKFDSGSVVFR